MKLKSIVFLAILTGIAMLSNSVAYSQTYVVPPTSITSANVPYISDAAMVKCVSLYNQAKWLSEDIDRTTVDEYSQESVNAYNSKVTKHSQMTLAFNRDCAGKQSESAYKAAQALNKASKAKNK